MFKRNFNFTLKKKQDFSTSISETSETVFYFRIGWLPLMWSEINTKQYKVNKRTLKVQEKDMSCELASNFDQ